MGAVNADVTSNGSRKRFIERVRLLNAAKKARTMKTVTAVGTTWSQYELEDVYRMATTRKLRVFPLRNAVPEDINKGKIPLHTGYTTMATCDPTGLAEAINADPGRNWGVLCGNGLVIIDVDMKDGKNGKAVLDELTGGEQIDTFTVRTPSGGWHYYFHVEGDVRGYDLYKPMGVEIKGHNNHVVAPNSVLNGLKYVVEKDAPIATAPDWLLKLLSERRKPTSVISNTTTEAVYEYRSMWGLRKALMRIDPDCDYDAWMKVLWAAQAVYGSSEATKMECERWSKLGLKWDEAVFHKTWAAFDAARSFDSLDYWATQFPLNRYTLLPPVSTKFKARADELAERVAERTIRTLERDGNEVNDEHRDDLHFIAKALAYGNFTDSPRRLALPLFAGGGKTLTVLGFVAEIAAGKGRRGIWIATATIEEIEDIRRELKNLGVPTSKVGYRMSNKRLNTVTNTTASKYPIIFVTHERIKMQDYEYLMGYEENERQLIWDEALVAVRSVWLPTEMAHRAVSDYEFALKRATDYEGIERTLEQQKTLDYLKAIIATFDSTEERGVVPLPKHPGKLALDVYSTPFLEMLANPSSDTALVDRKEHLFWYSVQVPDKFKNITILDASHEVRELVQLDRSIVGVPMKAKKSFKNLRIHFATHPQGKSTLKDPSAMTRLCKEVVSIRNSIPEEERLVVFHLPENSETDHAPTRLQDMLGLEADGLVFRSWGEAKGVNTLRDHKYGSHVGMVFRNPSEFKTQIAGMMRNKEYDVPRTQQLDTQLGEHADQVTQAINRLACRKTVDGACLPTDFWLFYSSEDIVDRLRRVMPDFELVKYDPDNWEAKSGKSKHLVEVQERVVPYLETVGFEVTINQLRKDLEYTGSSPYVDHRGNPWKALKKHLVNELLYRGYEIKGQTIAPIFKKGGGGSKVL